MRHTSLIGTLPPVWSRYGKEVLAHALVATDAGGQPATLDPSQLEPIDRREVAHIFAITLEELVDPKRQKHALFRDDPLLPYIEWDVRDETQGYTGAETIWGLSGWTLNVFARAIGLL